MIDVNISMLIQLINFFIVLAVLNAILYRPIRAVIKKRAQRMSAQLHDVENFTAQAQEKMAAYTSALAAAQQQGVEIRSKLKADGYQEETTLLDGANKSAAQELKAAREDAASQVRAGKKTLTSRVDGYARQVSEKVVGWAV
ncbi:ATP synthase F0 subunit B [Desulfonatronum thiodismutans]|uniref:ATP synthase F0 subunit B n=1 Tax=Desulfonatronum thiodismutans TaxID=159290 RepID=UPI0004ABE0F2|nr:ATP synthase F0 subunit B [Desulfonatronum thiodismutans]